MSDAAVEPQEVALRSARKDGRELVRLPAGSRVYGNAMTESMMTGGGGGAPVINLYVEGSIRSDRDLIKLMRDELSNGGLR